MPIERHPIRSREEWLSWRRLDLTASDIGAVAGLDDYRSRLSVWSEKAGIVGAQQDNNLMRRGRWLEVSVIEALRERHPDWDIRRAKVYLRDPDLRMGATPDAVATDPTRDGLILIQCKVVSEPMFEKHWWDKPPLKYEVQTLAEAMLVESQWQIIAALVISTYSAELHEYIVPRHGPAEDRIRDIVTGFWRDVASGRQPVPDYQKDAKVIEHLRQYMQPGKVIDLSTDNRMPELLDEHSRLVKERRIIVDALRTTSAEIADKIGDAEEAIVPGWKVTRRTVLKDAYVQEASEYRRLHVKDKREKEGPF